MICVLTLCESKFGLLLWTVQNACNIDKPNEGITTLYTIKHVRGTDKIILCYPTTTIKQSNSHIGCHILQHWIGRDPNSSDRVGRDDYHVFRHTQVSVR